MSDIIRVLSMSSSSSKSTKDSEGGSSSSSSSSYASNFLKWRDPKTSKINGVPISKNATVWIDTTDFKQVRAILNRAQLQQVVIGNTTGELQTQSQRTDETTSTATASSSSSSSVAIAAGKKQSTGGNNGKKRPVSDENDKVSKDSRMDTKSRKKSR